MKFLKICRTLVSGYYVKMYATGVTVSLIKWTLIRILTLAIFSFLSLPGCYCFVVVYLLSRIWLFCKPMDCSLPGFMGFPRQEYWSRLPFPSPGIFLTQGSNPGLLHWDGLLHCRWSPVLQVDSSPTKSPGPWETFESPIWDSFRKVSAKQTQKKDLCKFVLHLCK